MNQLGGIQGVLRVITWKKVSYGIKGKVYRSCVRSAMLHGSEVWCLKENEKAILRTERAKVRAMCGRKVATERRLKSRWAGWDCRKLQIS